MKHVPSSYAAIKARIMNGRFDPAFKVIIDSSTSAPLLLGETNAPHPARFKGSVVCQRPIPEQIRLQTVSDQPGWLVAFDGPIEYTPQIVVA